VDSRPRCLILFEESLKSQVTKKNYKESLARFLKWSQKDYDSLLSLPQNDLQVLLEDYVIFLKRRMNPNSVPKYLSSVIRFLKVNRKIFDKEAIKALYPEEIEEGGERAITIVKISAVSLSVYLLLIPLGDVTNFGSLPNCSQTLVTSFPPP